MDKHGTLQCIYIQSHTTTTPKRTHPLKTPFVQTLKQVAKKSAESLEKTPDQQNTNYYSGQEIYLKNPLHLCKNISITFKMAP